MTKIRVKNIILKICVSYCCCVLVWIVYHLKTPAPKLALSQNASHIRKRVTEQQQSKYDSKIKGSSEENRLGFAIKPPFQTPPKFWKNILPTKFVDSGQSQSLQKVKRILLYDPHPTWNHTYCPLYNSQAEFKCEFIEMSSSTSKNGNEFNNSLEDLLETVDAIFVVRNYRHTENVQRLLDVAVSKNRGNAAAGVGLGLGGKIRIPKLIYWTAEAPFWLNSFSMRAQPKYKQTEINDPSRDYLASYWRGSDIYSPYYVFEPFNKSDPRTNNIAVNYAEGRTKAVAIVVSNCGANNNRLGLVRELQKYINVDVYGRCGTLKCDRKACFNRIRKEYKFYLAFENSNCRDYITEKLFKNAFSNDLLPIVMGAHPSDYKAIAPTHSYIHVEDFGSVQKLSEYLNLLDKNDTLYNGYFNWKNVGVNKQNNFFCEACAFLHAQSLLKNQIQENTVISETVHLKKGNTTLLPYLHFQDEYSFETFNWTSNDDRLCLKRNQWYWNWNQ